MLLKASERAKRSKRSKKAAYTKQQLPKLNEIEAKEE